MADEKRDPPETAEAARRRKRPRPPVIELTATEVGAPPPPPPPPRETFTAPADDLPPPPPRNEQPRASAAKRPIAPLLSYALAGFAGAAMVAFVWLTLWLFGAIADRADLNEADARIAALEKQAVALGSRPASAPALDPQVVDALAQRLARAEQSIAKIPAVDPANGERLAATENALSSAGVALAALNRRLDDIAAQLTELRGRNDSAAAQNLDAVEKRIAALESAPPKADAPDNATRLALSAGMLRDAVARGAPFAAELAAVKSLGGDAGTLAPLEPFAASGVPNNAALSRDLTALLPAMRKAANVDAARSGSFIDRLQANASNLVRIRPVDVPPGDDATAVFARIEVKASQADIDGALAEIAKLPASARAPAEGWVKQAEARRIAIAAGAKFAADATRALGKP